MSEKRKWLDFGSEPKVTTAEAMTIVAAGNIEMHVVGQVLSQVPALQ